MAVHTGRNKLESMSALFGDKKFLSRSGFIIHDLEVCPMASLCESCYYAVESGQPMVVVA